MISDVERLEVKLHRLQYSNKLQRYQSWFLVRAEPGRVALFSLEWSFFLRTSSWHHRHLIPEQLQESSCVGVDDGHCCVHSSPDLMRSNDQDSCVAKLYLVLLACSSLYNPSSRLFWGARSSTPWEFKTRAVTICFAYLEAVLHLQLVDYDPGHWFNGWPRCRRGWRRWQRVWRRTSFDLRSLCIRPDS